MLGPGPQNQDGPISGDGECLKEAIVGTIAEMMRGIHPEDLDTELRLHPPGFFLACEGQTEIAIWSDQQLEKILQAARRRTAERN